MKPSSQRAGQFHSLSPCTSIFLRIKGWGRSHSAPFLQKAGLTAKFQVCVCCQRSVQSCVGADSPFLVWREQECLVAAGYLKLGLGLSVCLFILGNFGLIPITLLPGAALSARIMTCFEKCLKYQLPSIERTPGSCSFMCTS